MRLHYQRVNPDIGGESLLLRFEGLLPEHTVCLLVNSGRGVQVDSLLDESRGEYLGGIIVNNAHPEYYCTLGENLSEETPIYAAPDTAAILSEALSEPHARTVDRAGAILDQLVPIDDWSQVAHGLQIHPVPAGHAPGAAGFLFEIQNEKHEESQEHEQERDSEQPNFHTLLVADEVTARQAAGYPGIDLDPSVAVDALLLTDTAETTFTSTLTETLSIICERARNNATVLVTADEPTGMHAAYLLGHLGQRLGSSFPITIAGRTARLCEQLGFSIPNVTLLPEGTPEKVLTPGTVAIASPNAPVQGVSGRLFETLADDPNAAVIRLTRGVATPMSTARCMIQSFPWHNFSDQKTLDTIIEKLAPIQVVVGDQTPVDTRDSSGPDYDSFVWTVEDDLVYTLYDGTRWIAPDEIDPDIEQRIRRRSSDRYDAPAPSETELSIPLPERRAETDLAAEGLDIDVIRNRLQSSIPSESWRHRAPTADSPNAAPTDADGITTSATDGGTASIETALAALREQLDTLESAVNGKTYEASVIDAGSNMCLFRLQNPPISFEHGEDVSLVLDTSDDGEETTTSKRENGSDPVDKSVDATNETV